MEFIGVLLAVLGLAYGIWQGRRADRAQAELRAAVKAMPNRVAAQVEHLLAPQHRDAEEFEPNVLRHADIDGDGENEILLEYLAPATGRLLKVFDWSTEGELVEVGELFSQQPGFRYADLDGDGKTEIVALVTHPDAENIALAPRAEIIWKWDGRQFREITGFRWPDEKPEQAVLQDDPTQ